MVYYTRKRWPLGLDRIQQHTFLLWDGGSEQLCQPPMYHHIHVQGLRELLQHHIRHHYLTDQSSRIKITISGEGH